MLAREPYKPDSSVAWAVDVLREADQDLHIDVLVERIRAKGHEVEKPTLLGNLSRYVKDGKVFTRHSRSHYGLLEWQQKEIEKMLEEMEVKAARS